jgi:hypothetical protein
MWTKRYNEIVIFVAGSGTSVKRIDSARKEPPCDLPREKNDLST